jgi:hypothetical protein
MVKERSPLDEPEHRIERARPGAGIDRGKQRLGEPRLVALMTEFKEVRRHRDGTSGE